MIKHLGDEHPVTLLCLNSVGSYMRKERRCDDARKIHRKGEELRGAQPLLPLSPLSPLVLVAVLFSRLKAIGSEHIDTIDTINNLGNNYHVGKDYSNAFEFYQTAINTFERTLGKTHPNTLMIVMNEAIIWFTLKNFAKAEAMLQRALDGYVAQFGKDHDDTARFVMNFKIALRSNRSKVSSVPLVEILKLVILTCYRQSIARRMPKGGSTICGGSTQSFGTIQKCTAHTVCLSRG